MKLKRWEQRRRKDLGLNSGGRLAPLVDQVHCIMHVWGAGDVQRVDGYLEDQGLRRNPVLPRLLQALVELARKDNQHDERALLESIVNHDGARVPIPRCVSSWIRSGGRVSDAQTVSRASADGGGAV